jgi:hypothetical protein
MSAMSTDEIAAVLAWHEALNAGETERLLALSSEDVEVGGPRGTGRGHALLREWVDRARIRLEVDRLFHRAGAVVVRQRARWDLPDAGPTAPAEPVASVFRVRDGLVAGVVRYPDLATALEAAGLDESDEVGAGPGGADTPGT